MWTCNACGKEASSAQCEHCGAGCFYKHPPRQYEIPDIADNASSYRLQGGGPRGRSRYPTYRSYVENVVLLLKISAVLSGLGLGVLGLAVIMMAAGSAHYLVAIALFGAAAFAVWSGMAFAKLFGEVARMIVDMADDVAEISRRVQANFRSA